ncbi:hypothetical protein AVEN_247418-1, partial [Araneus ventricosus]
NAVKQEFIWTSLQKDCTEFCKRCIPCQKSKVVRHVKSPQGYSCCLTAVDRFTRWPEVSPIIDQKVNTLADTFYSGWISSFRVPEVITTDQGRKSESDLFHSLTKYLDISKIRTAAYNPSANDMVERFHRQLKALMCRLGSTERWIQQVPTILLGIRIRFKEDINALQLILYMDLTCDYPANFCWVIVFSLG